MIFQTDPLPKPFITGLARIDDDGQELRYPETRDGSTSLANHNLANLVVVRASISEMKRLSRALTCRVHDLNEQRITGAYTTECSREDLMDIASRLPPKEKWHTEAFPTARDIICDEYGLSRRKFSDAVDIIKHNRAMKALYGERSDLGGIDDETIIFITESWLSRET